ncbi:MAG: methylenetetrahydrofolate reductase [Hyphomicrobiaceae bacterium]|nr:MAG: methylenetetrahydrofolate reductase [Hyphomicrobiaceae bacterium]
MAQTSPPNRLPVSIEVAPRALIAAGDISGLIPKGTAVYIVDMESTIHTNAEIAAAASTIRKAGAVPVPHIAARRLLGLATLEERLKRLSSEAGVTDVLVIGGGAREPQGPFASSMDVLSSGLLDRYGVKRIGIAGHPEGSPDITPEQIETALAQKIEFGKRTNAEMRIVTQFGFDTDRLFKWAAGLQAAGVSLPIHAGIAGPASIASLLKFAVLCGVKASTEFLSRKGSAIATLLTGYDPEHMAAEIEARAGLPGDAIAALHIFPFGGIKKASEWLRRRGSWTAPSLPTHARETP